MKKAKFVITKDKKTSEQLELKGYRRISSMGGVYVHENADIPEALFQEMKDAKIAYTNIFSI